MIVHKPNYRVELTPREFDLFKEAIIDMRNRLGKRDTRTKDYLTLAEMVDTLPEEY